jgi:hypothetical protein
MSIRYQIAILAHKLRHTPVSAIARQVLVRLGELTGFGAPKRCSRSEFDVTHGVDTDGCVRITSMHVQSANSIYAKSYVPANPDLLRATLQQLDLPAGVFTFVDLGSGKGRQLLVASEFPFRSIIGVEFAANLHEIALANIRTYASPLQKCKNIKAVMADVVVLDLPEEPLVLFSYNSFEAPVLEKVLSNIARSWNSQQRDIIFIYANPVCEDVFAKHPFMTRVPVELSGIDKAHQVAIYRT